MGGRGAVLKISAKKAFRDSLQRTDKIRKEIKDMNTDEIRKIIKQKREETNGVGQKDYDRLKKYAESKGWKIVEKPLIEGRETVNGMARMGKGIIEIKSGLSISNKVKTMAHEIFHMNKHSPKSGRSRLDNAKREMEAETFADMAMQKLGGKSPSSPYYVEGWRMRGGASTNYLGKEARPHLEETFKDMFPDS